MTQLWRSFGDRLPIIVVAAMGIAATVLVLRRLAMRGRRIAVIAVLSMWLTAVAALTLLPAAGMRGRSIDLLPLRSTANMLLHAVDWQVAASQVGGNLILFIPLGLFLPLLSASARRSVLHTAGVAAAIACGIEAAQWVLAIGRVTAIDDGSPNRSARAVCRYRERSTPGQLSSRG